MEIRISDCFNICREIIELENLHSAACMHVFVQVSYML